MRFALLLERCLALGLLAVQTACLAAAPTAKDSPRSAIARAEEFLASAQDEEGEFPSTVCDQEGRCWLDSTPFITTFVLASTRGLESTRLARARERALDFLEREMLPGGLWRYWTFRAPYVPILQPDLDDTVTASEALLAEGRLQVDNRELIRRNVDLRGRYLTWLLPSRRSPSFDLDPAHHLRNAELRPGYRTGHDDFESVFRWLRRNEFPNETDPAVNANVLFYLGEEPPSVCDYLNAAAAAGDPSVYYLGNPAQYYMYGRAFRRGIRCLESSGPPILARLLPTQTADGSFGSPQMTALVLNILQDFGYRGPEVGRAVRFLLSTQRADGSWLEEFFFKESAFCKKCRYWRSASLASALGIEALRKALPERSP